MPTIDWRNQYDSEENDVMSEESGLDCSAETDRAVQDQKDDTDINILVRRFGLTGHMPAPQAIPFYGDFSEVGTFQEALEALDQAESAFNALPAPIRDRFQNDPGELIRFVQNDGNRAEAISLGLLPKPAPEVTQVPITTAP